MPIGPCRCNQCIDGYTSYNGEADYDNDDAPDYDEGDYYDEPDYNRFVQSYSYTPELMFHGDGPLFLGMELELNPGWRVDGDRLAETADTNLGSIAYLKEDGSLDAGGFEIVTHPMSYDYAMKSFPWETLAKLERDGAVTEDETGIHVHVSREGFDGAAHMYRWMKLIYRNEDEVSNFAGRTYSRWARFTPDARKSVKKAVDKQDPYRFSQNRYQAINVQNEATLELRIFRSSLNPNRVRQILTFVAASVEYARQLTAREIARNDGWSWKAFDSWVAARPEYAATWRQEGAAACAS